MDKILDKTATVAFLETEAIEEISSCRSIRSEAPAYCENIRRIAMALKDSRLPDETLFETSCSHVSLVKGEKKIRLFLCFMDTFSNEPWKLQTYCDQHFVEFQKKLELVEQLLT